jgi:hypothetical protein
LDDPDVSAIVCHQRAEECLVLAERMTDPFHKASMLVLAEWWMRLAQHDRIVGHILYVIDAENGKPE